VFTDVSAAGKSVGGGRKPTSYIDLPARLQSGKGKLTRFVRCICGCARTVQSRAYLERRPTRTPCGARIPAHHARCQHDVLPQSPLAGLTRSLHNRKFSTRLQSYHNKSVILLPKVVAAPSGADAPLTASRNAQDRHPLCTDSIRRYGNKCLKTTADERASQQFLSHLLTLGARIGDANGHAPTAMAGWTTWGRKNRGAWNGWKR
jgi:hypothetical protein